MRDFFKFVRHFFEYLRFVAPTLVVLLGLLLVAAALISIDEKIGYGDALYFTMITGLTVGYGDVVPTTILSRVVSVLVGLIGLIFFGIIVAVATRALGKTVGEKRDLRNPKE